LDTADTAENEKALGRSESGRGSSAFPKIRFVALLESGTHVLCRARIGPYRTHEIDLAREVLPALQKGMPSSAVGISEIARRLITGTSQSTALPQMAACSRVLRICACRGAANFQIS